MTRKRGVTQSPAAFLDIKPVLDAALTRHGLRVEFKKPGDATQFRLRANRYRKLLLSMEEERTQDILGLRPSTAYDHLVFSISKSEPNVVVINQRAKMTDMKVVDPTTGKEIAIDIDNTYRPTEESHKATPSFLTDIIPEDDE